MKPNIVTQQGAANDSIKLPRRILRILANANIIDGDTLCRQTRMDLLRLRGIGHKMLELIEYRLSLAGLHLPACRRIGLSAER